MKIAIDGILAVVTPNNLNWQEPPVLSKDGNRAPIIGSYWKCRLALSRVTSVMHEDWFTLRDGATHTFLLPHPATGTPTTYTGYVDNVVGRFDVKPHCRPAMTGMDVMLSGIVVSIA